MESSIIILFWFPIKKHNGECWSAVAAICIHQVWNAAAQGSGGTLVFIRQGGREAGREERIWIISKG